MHIHVRAGAKDNDETWIFTAPLVIWKENIWGGKLWFLAEKGQTTEREKKKFIFNLRTTNMHLTLSLSPPGWLFGIPGARLSLMIPARRRVKFTAPAVC